MKKRSTVMLIASVTVFLTVICSCGSVGRSGIELAEGFENPSDEYRPWCYWFWLNGHVDTLTIDKDLEAIKGLGFGGVLIVDPRGYWDDDDHVKMAAPEIDFMSDEWVDNVTGLRVA